ncbi:porin [Vibrio sp. SCSIO 43135]|uniref:Porin n=1 Tax=Vibrio paucivorans TaxID=2829489 RepID=A0A9X3CB08_9VIBR|nr:MULTISPECIES: porin [Vibrio]MCW8332405.1 porin [Vibrio paucivorans]USD43687.1 porin [Vibrio sp. SCSIO 43135]
MKIKLLAAAIAATACGTQAFAAEVYNSEGSTLSIGGYVDVGVGEYGDDDDIQVNQVSPRLNVGGTQDIGNGVVVDAKGEWQLNYLNGGGTSFTTRLGYIGATHETGGRLAVGTQWAPYYDVAGVADLPIAFANDFLYENQAITGSGRGDKMVTYRNSFNVAKDSSVSLGLGWQGENTGVADSRMQIALSVDIIGIALGYTYSGGDIGTVDATSHVLSLAYGNYGNGVYVATVYGMNENFYDGLEESIQMESLFAYGLGNGVNLSLNYEAVLDDKNDLTQFSQSALQAEYTVTPNLVTFAGYQFDLGDDYGTEEDDKWIIGARYFL